MPKNLSPRKRGIKIAFAGTPEFALPSLQNLVADPEIEIVRVFTQPDRPIGRGQKIGQPPVKILAEKLGIPVEQNKLTAVNLPVDLDLLAVVAFGQILPTKILEIPRFGCVNLHSSLLPQFRGASPVQSVILAGDEKTGVSFQKISAELDAGDIFASFELPILNENSAELAEKLAQLGGEKFPAILKKIAAGAITAAPQNSADATFCSKIRKSDGRVEWAKNSTEILLRKKRAFAEWPEIWTTFAGANLKLVEFAAAKKFPGKRVSEVFEFEKNIFVATTNGALRLEKIQLAGKKILAAADFARGNSNFVGSFLK